MKDIKVIFMGTPIFASIILDELIKKYNVIIPWYIMVSKDNKEQTIEAYNKIYGNEKLKEFIYKYWNDEKMVLTYPNLTLKLEDGKIMYVKDLTPEIKPYYYKFNERKIKKIKDEIINSEGI